MGWWWAASQGVFRFVSVLIGVVSLPRVPSAAAAAPSSRRTFGCSLQARRVSGSTKRASLPAASKRYSWVSYAGTALGWSFLVHTRKLAVRINHSAICRTHWLRTSEYPRSKYSQVQQVPRVDVWQACCSIPSSQTAILRLMCWAALWYCFSQLIHNLLVVLLHPRLSVPFRSALERRGLFLWSCTNPAGQTDR